jgi:hypothetical protein
MKKVLVLNGDSYVGRHVVKAFHQSREYEIELTRAKSDARKAGTTRATATADAHGWMWADSMARDGNGTATLSTPSSPDSTRKRRSRGSSNSCSSSRQQPQQRQKKQHEAEKLATLPADIRHCVSGIVPKHNDDTEGFRTRLLANDVVVAVLEDDVYEATCAIRILESTHYNVEKTFVLVSSALTWAYTLESERARARLTRQRERAEARDTLLEGVLDEEEEAHDEQDGSGAGGAAAAAARASRRAARRRELEKRLPPSLREPLPGEEEDEIRELVPDRVFAEDGYAQRVPHPCFQHWHALEHLVKRANSQTLHTYVVFAGLPYGSGEGESMLYGLLRSAWYHQTLLQYGPGANAIPMIHVQDLAAILFRLGNSYDTLEERYLFAVDQGKVTQRQLLHAVQAKLGGSVQPATSVQYQLLDITAPVTATTAVFAAAAAAAGAPTSASNGTSAGGSSSGSNQLHPNAAGIPSSALFQPAAAAGGGDSPTTAVGAAAATLGTTSTFSADLVKVDRLELPVPSSPHDLFRVFGNEPCWGDGGAVLSAFVLSDIQAEPAAVLNFYPAEEWVALEGFAMSLDLVLAQFREAHAHMFRPVRALITGPPLSGADSLAVLVGQQCHAPVLTRPTIVRDYAAHVAEVREALRRLLVRRLQRRRARVQARLVRQAAEAQRARKAARAERRREQQGAAKQTKGGRALDGDDDTDPAGDREEDDDAETTAGVMDTEDTTSDDSFDSSFSIFIPPTVKRVPADADNADDAVSEEADHEGADNAGPHHQQRALVRTAEEVVDEAYIRGGAAAGAGDDAAGEGSDMADEEQEEVEGDGEAAGGTWMDQLEEHDAEKQAELSEGQELLPEEGEPLGSHYNGGDPSQLVMPRFAARRRGRAFARDVDRQELRCVTALRREYLLGLKVLALKVSPVDGRLPRPLPPPASGDDEDGDGDGEGARMRESNSKAAKALDDGGAGDDELEGSGGSHEGGGDAVAAETEDDDSTDAKESEGGEGDNATSAAADSDATWAGDAVNYLDAALAFMFRWRIRQSDCRCQGYVLSNFPETLTQAVLCFRANEAELEDAELRRQRALAPLLTSLDDHETNPSGNDDDAAPLPPPLDEDFPLPDIGNMEEAQLRALERAHWRSRGAAAVAAAATPHALAGATASDDDVADDNEAAEAVEPEEVMAPVDEELFVDYVVSLHANPIVLRATADALEADLTASLSSAPAGGSAQPQSPQLQPSTGKAVEAHALDALRAFLSSSSYARRLEEYLYHHAPAAPPTQSLLTWLRVVTTTPALGVRPAPVVVPLASDTASAADGAATGESAGGEGTAMTTTLEAPSTTRTAEIVTVSAPVLSVPQVKASWAVAYAASHPPDSPRGKQLDRNRMASPAAGGGARLLMETLPTALLRLAPQFWTGDGRTAAPASSFAVRSSNTMAVNTTPLLPPSLQELQRAVCVRLVPPRRLAACPATAAVAVTGEGKGVGGSRTALMSSSMSISSAGVASTAASPHGHPAVSGGASSPDGVNYISTIARERQQQTELEKRESQLADLALKEGAAHVLQERKSLRRLQLAEESLEAASLLQMPTETYLMKYVLPSLTPAMTEVVRVRSDDPVTALANVLYDYHRRTTI